MATRLRTPTARGAVPTGGGRRGSAERPPVMPRSDRASARRRCPDQREDSGALECRRAGSSDPACTSSIPCYSVNDYSRQEAGWRERPILLRTDDETGCSIWRRRAMIKAVKFVSVPVTATRTARWSSTPSKLGFDDPDGSADGPRRPAVESSWACRAPTRASSCSRRPGRKTGSAASSNVAFASDHVEKTRQELAARGVEFVQPAEEGAVGNIGDLQGPGRQPVRAVEQLNQSLITDPWILRS